MRLKKQIYPGLLALIVLSTVIITTQCVEDYNPNIPANDNLLVVNGSIIRGNEQQTIIISRSTSINNPRSVAVEGCKVFVTDDSDNVFPFEEQAAGKYIAEIDIAYLKIGAKFKLTIETPANQVYESGYEEIYDSPPIDSLYFLQESNYSNVRNAMEDGLRLNVDLYSKEGYNGYYRYRIHETWETRSSNYRIDKMLIGVKDTFITVMKYDSLDSQWVRDRAIPIPEFETFDKPDTFHICYHDSEVDEIFYSSTSNIGSNLRKRVPLNFISNGPKIGFRYSCLVSQYTLSEGAYNYWQNKKSEITESGGMFFTQPSQNLSNIKNINNDQESVLGYFWASLFKQKRVFFEGPYIGRLGFCSPELFDVTKFYEQDPHGSFGEFRRVDTAYYPVYLFDDLTNDPVCFDCRFSGGTLIKPDFW